MREIEGDFEWVEAKRYDIMDEELRMRRPLFIAEEVVESVTQRTRRDEEVQLFRDTCTVEMAITRLGRQGLVSSRFRR